MSLGSFAQALGEEKVTKWLLENLPAKLLLAILLLAAPLLSAEDWTELRVTMNNGPTESVIAGTQLDLELACTVVTVTDNGEEEVPLTGTALLWVLVRGEEPVSVLISVQVDFSSGSGQFVWVPEIAGPHTIIATLPESPDVLPGQTAEVYVAAGVPDHLELGQFESELKLVPFDGGELSEWSELGFGGSTWIEFVIVDEFGNLCELRPENNDTTLDLDILIDAATAETWGLDFFAAYISDNGFDEGDELGPVDGGDETFEDKDAVNNMVERCKAYMAYTTFSLGSYTPRPYSSRIYLRLLGTASTPPPSTSAVLGPLLSVSGSVGGASFSGSSGVRAGASSLVTSTTYAEPYLVMKSNTLNRDYGRDQGSLYWTPNRLRYIGVASGWGVQKNLDAFAKVISPATTGSIIAGRLNAGLADYASKPFSVVKSTTFGPECGSPSIYGCFDVEDGAFINLAAAFESGDTFAACGWEYEVAFPQTPGAVQPTHVFGGRCRRYLGAYARATSGIFLGDNARAQVTWSTDAWGSSFSNGGETKHEVSAHDGTTYIINGASVGAGGLSVNVESTTANNPTDALNWDDQDYLINESGLVMQAGFSVGYKADGFEQGSSYKLGVADYICIAPINPPGYPTLEIGPTNYYTATNCDTSDYSFVRVGYSAPGTGGVIWTSGQWLR